MTDQPSEDPTQTGELGPMPDAEIEPGETNPGGVDALPEPSDVVPADLDPSNNPSVEESPDPLKRSLSEGEDTDTEATRDAGGDADKVEAEKESPA